MTDPLAEVVALLQPSAQLAKVVSAAGTWRLRRDELGDPFYCAVLAGKCSLAIDGLAAIELVAGDFVLVPATHSFTLCSHVAPPAGEYTQPRVLAPGNVSLGDPDVAPDVINLVGHCRFRSHDAALLVSLLPRVVHVRGEPRLTTLVQLVGDESGQQRPARDMVLARLLEVVFIEALRSDAGTSASPGLLRGLADERLAAAIRCVHEAPAQAWTVAQLAKASALSRSAFFERFSRAVGVAPMAYLLAWRMALAKQLLARKAGGIDEVARRVGYSSASTFSVAFSRHVGEPPSTFARSHVA
jgi:AraC-like DNA-binding protein